MDLVRPAAVAGTFYPSDPVGLRTNVETLLAATPRRDLDLEPRMVIAPHAGYVYSGPVAAHAYQALAKRLASAPRVLLLGPSHFVGFHGLATVTARALETPLGQLAVDAELSGVAAAHAIVGSDDAAHAREHSLEVQLPFLQVTEGDISVVPLVTGTTEPEDVADVLGDLLEVPAVSAVISSDLSHFLDSTTAQRRDSRTGDLITTLHPEALRSSDACGCTAIQAALLVAQRLSWGCRLLDMRNSADTVGGRERVVGYGAFVIGPVC